jgi:hypothetical protein
MVYDPSARSRSASGVFPRGFPFTTTSASAGVERINMLPVCVRSTAPDAGRDGVGAALGPGAAGGATALIGASGAMGSAGSAGTAGAAAGRSTTVESTPGCFSVSAPAPRERRYQPTPSAEIIATTTNITAIGHTLRTGSSSIPAGSITRDAGANHEGTTGAGGEGGSARSTRTGASSSNVWLAPRSMTRSRGSGIGMEATASTGAMGPTAAIGGAGAGLLRVARTALFAPTAFSNR